MPVEPEWDIWWNLWEGNFLNISVPEHDYMCVYIHFNKIAFSL
jgi:hypothetical protein